MIYRQAAVVATVLLAGCGGGGGSDNAVSANPPAAAPPPGATAPVRSPVAPSPSPPAPVPAPGPITVPPPKPSPGAPPAPSPTGASVPGTSVVRALAAATNSRATSPGSDAASFDYFSTLSIGFDNSTGRFTSRSFLTPLNQRAEALRQEREVVLSIASTTNGSSNFVLGADGSVTGPQGQYGLSGSSYAIPATVPLDTTLVQYAATQGNGVRLFVGSIPDRPDQMRVCWNIDVPSALRVTCSRNLRSTGEPVGVDAVNDLSGTILTHASTDREPVRFTVLGCYAKEIEANVRTEGWVFRERWYDRTKSYGGILSEPWPYGPITVTRSGNRETVDYMTPRSTERHVVEDGVRIVEADSIVSGGTYSADIRCVEFGG